MRINYSYKNYPNCPRATEYSRSAESSAASFGPIIGLLSLAALITFLVNTLTFFGNYNWGEFLGGVAFLLAVILLDFYCLVARPRDTECAINVILMEEDLFNVHPSKEAIQAYSEWLRKKNSKENMDDFKAFYPVCLAIVSDAISLLAVIKSVYLLCHREGSLFLLLGALIALGIFSYLIWKSIKAPSSDTTIEDTVENSSVSPSASADDDIAFCRKCGAKIPPDSIFCPKCGTQVR